MYVPTEDSSYVRDTSTRALLNQDSAGYAAFKAARKAKQDEMARLEALENKVDTIASTLDAILAELRK